MPAGKYRLSIDYRSAYANSAASSFTMQVKGEKMAAVTTDSQTFATGATSFFESDEWNTLDIDFTLAESQKVTTTLNLNWLSGGSCIMFDNMRLLFFPEKTPVAVENLHNSPSDSAVKAWYTLDGRRIAKPVKGVYIVRTADNHSKKVVLK
jgi:hypothetical protein